MTVPAGRFIQPRVEAENAFILISPLHGAATARADIVAATDYVTPALEILDTRILRADPATGRARFVTDTVSDNAANAGIVLGGQKHRIDAHDLRWVGAILKRGGVVEETGLGAGVLDRSGDGYPVAGASAGAVWAGAECRGYRPVRVVHQAG